MLILSRRPSEVIKIGDDIEITILTIKGNQCRIGISAPPDVEVHRLEIYNKIKEEESNGN